MQPCNLVEAALMTSTKLFLDEMSDRLRPSIPGVVFSKPLMPTQPGHSSLEHNRSLKSATPMPREETGGVFCDVVSPAGVAVS